MSLNFRRLLLRRWDTTGFISSNTNSRQPYLLADYHREALLKNDGIVDNNDEEVGHQEPLTNVQEQRLLRKDAIDAFKSLAGDDEEEDDDFVLKKREGDDGDKRDDAEEYRRFLLEMGGGEDEVRKILGMGDQPAWQADEALDGEDASASSEDKISKKSKKNKKSALSEVEREEIQSKKRAADEDFLMK